MRQGRATFWHARRLQKIVFTLRAIAQQQFPWRAGRACSSSKGRTSVVPDRCGNIVASVREPLRHVSARLGWQGTTSRRQRGFVQTGRGINPMMRKPSCFSSSSPVGVVARTGRQGTMKPEALRPRPAGARQLVAIKQRSMGAPGRSAGQEGESTRSGLCLQRQGTQESGGARRDPGALCRPMAALPCYLSSARATPWRRAGRRLEVSSGRLIIRAWPELTRSRTPLPGPRGPTAPRASIFKDVMPSGPRSLEPR